MLNDLIAKLIAKSESGRDVPSGTRLVHQEDRVENVYIVTKGLLELVRHQHDGTSIVLQRAGPLSVLAEASVYSETYHCDAVAQLPSHVSAISKPTFLKLLQQDIEIAHLWSARLAKEVQSARSQIEILSQRTVADRLNHWLAWQSGGLPAKGNWKDVANQLGVSPEALYRELAKRRPK